MRLEQWWVRAGIVGRPPDGWGLAALVEAGVDRLPVGRRSPVPLAPGSLLLVILVHSDPVPSVGSLTCVLTGERGQRSRRPTAFTGVEAQHVVGATARSTRRSPTMTSLSVGGVLLYWGRSALLLVVWISRPSEPSRTYSAPGG